ncbi:MAG: ribosome-associated translation inhibitor RaiA [Psychrilyobacter sp.]|nr:ribosome-associated translation inhibitor RaiA [Psychrilyobacter sp.]
MRMIISGRHLEVTPAIREHAEKKIGKIKKYFDQIAEVYITLSAEHKKSGEVHIADVLVYVNGAKIKATESDKDLYAAIDEVVDVLEKQLTKHKEKLRDNKHAKSIKKFEFNAEAKSITLEKTRKIVSTKVMAKPMEVEEAILQMETMGKKFYIFMNAETEELNVVYKRRDGDYSHVEAGWE